MMKLFSMLRTDVHLRALSDSWCTEQTGLLLGAKLPHTEVQASSCTVLGNVCARNLHSNTQYKLTTFGFDVMEVKLSPLRFLVPRVGSWLRIDPLHLLTGCRKRRLNPAPLNFRGLIWLLMMDWSKRENVNKAALVTIVQCNTLVARCF